MLDVDVQHHTDDPGDRGIGATLIRAVIVAGESHPDVEVEASVGIDHGTRVIDASGEVGTFVELAPEGDVRVFRQVLKHRGKKACRTCPVRHGVTRSVMGHTENLSFK